MPNESSADALSETSEYLRILYLLTAVEDLHFLFLKIVFFKYLTHTDIM